MVDLSRMKAQLVLHEGLKLEPYEDLEENWTVLVGYNLTARGWEAIERILERPVEPLDCTVAHPFGTPHLTEADALRVLEADILRVQHAAQIAFPEITALNEVRQRVCLDLAFNIGFHALGFKNCIAAIKRRDWSTASRELYKSKWARQVSPDRCDRLARMLLTGLDYTL